MHNGFIILPNGERGSMNRSVIHLPSGAGERIADSVTAFVGSWLCIGLHSVWFVLWIGLRVEPFPYGLLTMIVSLEAIFLSTLVMISQNRQAEKDRKRDTLEADEVQGLYDNHQLLLQINQQQLAILQELRQLREVSK